MKLKLALGVGISLLASFTGALVYGIYSGCGYCGPTTASLWSVALLVGLPIIWGWSRPSREVQERIKKQCHCDHEFIQQEHQEVMAWHGDCPIWHAVKAWRCWKCAYSETRNFQGFS
jgi:hypothetical protein